MKDWWLEKEKKGKQTFSNFYAFRRFYEKFFVFYHTCKN